MDHPTWRTRRERLAIWTAENVTRLGWWLAPRSSRERWAAIAAGLEGADPSEEVAIALRILQEHYGFRVVEYADGAWELVGPDRYERLVAELG